MGNFIVNDGFEAWQRKPSPWWVRWLPKPIERLVLSVVYRAKPPEVYKADRYGKLKGRHRRGK